ncbi:MAG: cytochrome c [Flavobacteriales bacterium]|nr:cytochrome c [Flavobacteriales bacterium]
MDLTRPRIFVMMVSVALIAISACNTSPSTPTETRLKAPSAGEIQRAYTMKCSLCHGNDGKLMASKATDLSISTMTAEERVAIITYGKGTMPPQKGILDGAMITGLAEYIESFRD